MASTKIEEVQSKIRVDDSRCEEEHKHYEKDGDGFLMCLFCG